MRPSARDQAGTVADIADGADIAEDGWCEPEFGRVGDDRDGYLHLTDAPGLGIELNEDALPHRPVRNWRRTPAWRPDGAADFI